MSGISSWLLSVVGVVVLGTLINVVLPDSAVAKYVKGIYAFIIVLVIINPIFTLTQNKVDFNLDYVSYVDENFLNQVSQDKVTYLEKNIETQLSFAGLKNVEIKIETKNSENPLKIEWVYVFLNNLVIQNLDEHIDKYQVVEDIILSNLKINKEQIIYNE